MATADVPGYNPAHNDKLHSACWAEHNDGSLIFVVALESGKVIYSIFDTSQDPPLEYRDALNENDFKKAFSWSSGESIIKDKWTWHDKTPQPWYRIMKTFKGGVRYPSAEDQLNAAQKVAESLKLRAQKITQNITETGRNKGMLILDKISRAFSELRR